MFTVAALPFAGQVREHETGSHSVLLVNTLDRPGLLTGEGSGLLSSLWVPRVQCRRAVLRAGRARLPS